MFNNKFNKKQLLVVGAIAIALFGIGFEVSRINNTKSNNVKDLETKLNTLQAGAERWDEMNILALKTLANQPDIVSMDAKLQKPVLESVVNTYDHIYLSFTMDTKGYNLARSDNNAPKNYNDRSYYRRIMLGEEMAYQTLIGRSNGLPTLCMAAPIKQVQTLMGLAAICTDLQDLSEDIGPLSFGRTGSIYIVDRDGHLLGHPNPAHLRGEKLKNLKDYPPVKTVLEGRFGEFIFTEDDKEWVSFGKRLNEHWDIVAIVERSELTPSFRVEVIFILLVVGTGILLAIRKFQNFASVMDINVKPNNSNKNIPLPPRPGKLKNVNTLKQNKSVTGSSKCHSSSTSIPSRSSRSGQKNPQILVVHGDEGKRKYYSNLFSSRGFEVTALSNGELALAAAMYSPFDLILTDLFLDKISGIKMVKQLRKLKEYSHTPIVATSSQKIETGKCRNFLKGINAFLPEPILEQRLTQVIDKHLRIFCNQNKSNVKQTVL